MIKPTPKKDKMKKITALLFVAGFIQNIQAQTGTINYTVESNNVAINERNINTATIPFNSTTHFVSPEPIDYVAIS